MGRDCVMSDLLDESTPVSGTPIRRTPSGGIIPRGFRPTGRPRGSMNKAADLRKLLLSGAKSCGNRIARSDKEPGRRGIARWLQHCAERYPDSYLKAIQKTFPVEQFIDLTARQSQ